MIRATLDSSNTSAQTSAVGDDQTSDEDASEVVETASTLMSMRNVQFAFSTEIIAEKKTGKSKSNASIARSQQGKGKEYLVQTTNETTQFDAKKGIMIRIKGESNLPEVHNMAGEPVKLFSDEELRGLLEIVKVEDDYVEVVCTCTSKTHGHYVGHLKVFRDGKLLIDCKCIPGCDLENVTPEQFVTHARARLGPSEWPRCIWVYESKGGRILLTNSPLLRYFEIAGMKVEKRIRFRIHRDEFLKCTECGIERRFKLKSREECKEYHEAFLMKDSWTCSMHSRDKIECGSEGERATRKLVRGCPRNGTCRGCSRCACYGCHHCRFADCGCRICMDFTGRNIMQT